MTHCPFHPDCHRIPRFEYLDLLIDRGWGSVPQPLIARLFRENGGKLPKTPPPGYYEITEEVEERIEGVKTFKRSAEQRAAQSARQRGKEKNDHRKLPPDQVAEVLRLRGQGLSYIKIGLEMSISPYKVRWTIQRAKKQGSCPQVFRASSGGKWDNTGRAENVSASSAPSSSTASRRSVKVRSLNLTPQTISASPEGATCSA